MIVYPVSSTQSRSLSIGLGYVGRRGSEPCAGRVMSSTVKRSKCVLCGVELERRELPRIGEQGFCDRCLKAHQTRPVQGVQTDG